MDDREFNEIRRFIANIVRSEIKKYMKNTEMVYDGLISVDENNTISCEVKGVKYDNIPNFSGKTLENGDMVRVYARDGKIMDGYIGVAWGQPISITESTIQEVENG